MSEQSSVGVGPAGGVGRSDKLKGRVEAQLAASVDLEAGQAVLHRDGVVAARLTESVVVAVARLIAHELPRLEVELRRHAVAGGDESGVGQVVEVVGPDAQHHGPSKRVSTGLAAAHHHADARVTVVPQDLMNWCVVGAVHDRQQIGLTRLTPGQQREGQRLAVAGGTRARQLGFEAGVGAHAQGEAHVGGWWSAWLEAAGHVDINAALRRDGVDITLLATGIWEALITTIGGLSVGIICILFYNYLVGKVETMSQEIEDKANDFFLSIRRMKDAS